ncbi:MAG: TadE/TadG family type IV pilus assembly protein [Pseudomonadota bacterium]
MLNRLFRVLNLARKANRCESGLAATEFAMSLPIMLLIFFGLTEGSDALTADRRVSVAVNAMADLVAQAEEITQDEVDDLFTGVERMLEPNDPEAADFRLLSISLQNGQAKVDWSIDNGGSEPYEPNSVYENLEDETILESGISLIIVELTYSHQTTMVNRIFDDPITFDRRATRWPRTSSKVELCNNQGECV